jgi:hypothetical protein
VRFKKRSKTLTKYLNPMANKRIVGCIQHQSASPQICIFQRSLNNCSNFSISSGKLAAPSGNFFQYGQNLPLRAHNSDPLTGSKMSALLSANTLQSTIYAVRVYVSRPKRLQTVARFEKNYRMTSRVGLTV